MNAPVRVTLKLATSLDARIALSSGQSKWITGPEAREAVHQLRADHDVVLTGVGTILADNPQMTARPAARLRRVSRCARCSTHICARRRTALC